MLMRMRMRMWLWLRMFLPLSIAACCGLRERSVASVRQLAFSCIRRPLSAFLRLGQVSEGLRVMPRHDFEASASVPKP